MPIDRALRRVGTVCGVLAPPLWALAIVWCGSVRPDYSHLTRFISELGERGSATELAMRYGGFVPTGLMHVAFAASVLVRFRGNRLAAAGALLIALNGIARIGAGMFPCAPGCAGPRVLLSQKLHTLSAALGFFSFIGAAIAFAAVFRRSSRFRHLSAYSMATAIVALVFLLLMSWDSDRRTAAGLYERVSSGALTLWLFIFAIQLSRGERWPASRLY